MTKHAWLNFCLVSSGGFGDDVFACGRVLPLGGEEELGGGVLGGVGVCVCVCYYRSQSLFFSGSRHLLDLVSGKVLYDPNKARTLLVALFAQTLDLEKLRSICELSIL